MYKSDQIDIKYITAMNAEKPLLYELKGDTITKVYKNFTYKFSLASGYSWIEEDNKVMCQSKLSY